MQMELIDRSTDIYINNGAVSNDVLLVIVLVLLSVFALIFRLNLPFFGKLIKDLGDKEQKDSIFDVVEKKNFFFDAFMNIQPWALLSIFMFSIAVRYKVFENPGAKTTLLGVLALFGVFLLFYLFKRLIYNMILYLFVDDDNRIFLIKNYKSLFYVWGIFLYIPILWILLIDDYILYACIVLIISYIIIRSILMYRFIFTFLRKNIWFLLINLYLCAQEIVPLVLFYEGMIYMYKIIENNIWQ